MLLRRHDAAEIREGNLHRKLFGLSAVLAAVVCGSACQTVHYATQRSGGGGVVEDNADFFLFGLIGEKVVRMNEVCPAGPARWHNQETFVNGLLGVITLGIYTPRTIVIECAAAPPASPGPTSAEASAPSAG